MRISSKHFFQNPHPLSGTFRAFPYPTPLSSTALVNVKPLSSAEPTFCAFLVDSIVWGRCKNVSSSFPLQITEDLVARADSAAVKKPVVLNVGCACNRNA